MMLGESNFKLREYATRKLRTFSLVGTLVAMMNIHLCYGAQDADMSRIVDEHQKGMMNTLEQRWKDYELLTMVKNMLNTLVFQYNEFEYEKKVFEAGDAKEIKNKNSKSYEKFKNMEYKSDKMKHLLKRFHVEIKTPKERYDHVTTRAKIWTGVKRTVGVVIALTHAVGGNFAMI